MKYTSEFANELQMLDSMVLLQKEIDLYEHKKKHFKKMMVIHYRGVHSFKIKQDYRNAIVHSHNLKRHIPPSLQGTVDHPHLIISRYMDVYQVSIDSVARILNISPSSIHQFLIHNQTNSEIKPFIHWAIQNFRLDLNRYQSYLSSF